MKQFIRYLYEYEQGKRSRNVGFVKVERGDTESTIQIHGKGLRMTSGESLKVYLFYDRAGVPTGIPQGEIAYMGPAINYRLRYTAEDTGVPENYDKINGIFLENQNKRRFAALWEEIPFRIDDIVQWTEEAPMHETGQTKPDIPSENEQQEVHSGETETPPESEAGIEPECETGLKIESEAVPETEAELETEIGGGAEPEGGRKTAVSEMKSWKVTKIQRGEISRLPRCEWRLANNNFLMHGYYNYKYIVLLDNGKTLMLGVPGIYHEKEARAASGFGFPRFINIDETNLSKDPDDCEENQQFGFWCRQVRRPAM